MASKPKFSLDLDKITSGVDLKNTVANLDNPDNHNSLSEPRSFKKVPFKKLKSSPLNDYPIIEVEEMEHLLLAHGLLEPLSVSYIEEEDSYEIESGDRRFHALQNLYTYYENNVEDEDSPLYKKNVQPLFVSGVPCMVENGAQDRDSRRMRIIIHNETNRPFDPIRTSNRLAELAAIYSRQNKARPVKDRINVNEKIANDLNGRYSIRQIIRYKNFDSLTDELKRVVVKYDMNIATISTYHTLSETEQDVLAKYIENSYAAGSAVELPSIESIREIVSEQHSVSDSTENSESDTMSPENPDTPESGSILELKQRAAQKILEQKATKESKVKKTVAVLEKKTVALEKSIQPYISEKRSPEDISELLTILDSITQKIDTIKNSLRQ